MDDAVLEVHIREDDPRFGRALELANEVVAALVFWVIEPRDEQTCSLPTLSDVATELYDQPDPTLMTMFVFALGRCARNMTSALATERAVSAEAVLREFLLRPLSGPPRATS